jgi:KDO2-lipid IV(A) lauroyltransferase
MEKTGLRSRLEFAVFLGLKCLFFLFPRRLCLLLGGALGRLAYVLDKKHRQIALSNLGTAFPNQLSESQKKAIARNSFKNFGAVIADILKLPLLSEKKIGSFLTSEGLENLEGALNEGKGALLFTAHYGNWEVGSRLMSRKSKFNVIARPLDNPLLERELARLRKHLGARVIYKKQAAKEILQALRRNEVVAILIDQNVLRSEAVFVDFFGKAAATTPGLAAFSLRTGSPLLPVFCLPRASRSYHIKIFKPLETHPTGDLSQDVLKITQICTKIIENQIREAPDFWFWFHKRWNTRPPDEIQEKNLGPDERQRGPDEI